MSPPISFSGMNTTISGIGTNVATLTNSLTNINTTSIITTNAAINGSTTIRQNKQTKLMNNSGGGLAAVSFVITPLGQVHAWGRNDSGQLGNNSTSSSFSPIATSTFGSLNNNTVSSISSGQSHTVALDSLGRIHAWGNNGSGQLGNNTNTQSTIPIAIGSFGSIANKTIVMIAAGTLNTVVLDSTGQVHAWGNYLGNNTSNSSSVPIAIGSFGSLANKTIVAISAGYNHMLALDSTGQVHAWGSNGNGQLGNSSLATSLIPVAIGSFGSMVNKTIVSIVGGFNTSTALDSTGQVHTWGGNNGNGQLGNNTSGTSTVPVGIGGFGSITNKTVVSIACGAYHSIALDSTGQVHSWGFGGGYALGNNTTVTSTIPIAIGSFGSLNNASAVAITCGWRHTIVLDSLGNVHAWGYNVYGEIGTNLGVNVGQAVPMLVTGYGTLTSTATTASALVAPLIPNMLQTTLNVIGDTALSGTTTLNNVNVTGSCTLPNNSIASTSIVGGPNNGLSNLTLVGVSTTTLSTTNIYASGTANFAYASVSGLNLRQKTQTKLMNGSGGGSTTGGSSYIITPLGQIHAWGQNVFGQLGNGTLTNSSVPIAISSFGSINGKTMTSIACGQSHTIAIDSVGHVHTWGWNVQGQLGNNTLTNSTLPIDISANGSITGKTIIGIAASVVSSVAIDSLGQVHAWGNNGSGQLGNNTTTNSSIPIAVSTFGSIIGKLIVSIAMAGQTTIALDSTGQVHAWGTNASGQIGNNTTTSSSIPVAIGSFGSLIGKTISSIYSGQNSTYALDSAGQVHAWGFNNNGQLGNNSTTQSPIPVAISSFGSLVGAKIVSMACGYDHALAIDTLGNVHAWGNNIKGQLGNNTTNSSLVPINVSSFGSINGLPIVAIAAAFFFTLALDSSGNIHAWGYNDFGEIGANLAINVSQLVPIIVTGNGTLTTSSLTASTFAAPFFTNFTGQHRTFVQGSQGEGQGMIVVCDQNDYITGGPENTNTYGQFIRGQNAITINDSLPVVSLAKTAYDKRVFGVLSSDIYNLSPDVTMTPSQKKLLVEYGDVRMEVNAIGAGAIWVSDINGALSSGDFITSSTIPGYGQLQNIDSMHSYTVAKITCDCDFGNLQQPVYIVQTDENGKNVIDAATGQPIWIQQTLTIMVDPNTGIPPLPQQPNADGSFPLQQDLIPYTTLVTESKYKMRWLDGNGTQITEQEYAASISAGSLGVYRAAFVGCTYHCG